MPTRSIPELLAPAGSLDAVRAAIANGADAVYLGAERFNARDEGAQLTLDEVAEACRLAHSRGRKIYLTLNILLKPAELHDALMFLGEAIDRGIDAVIVQDIGLVRLIRRVYPELEIHGSTQMTIHDESGARVVQRLGVERIVLARENTLDDVRAIRAAVPELGLETFVHGALCISYSGQCYMSGMISERSANRGSCAQSCRKDYVLEDKATGAELDRGFLISTKDLAAHDHLAEIAEAGVGCLKVEGRKKRPEYVATVTHAYREWLDRLEQGESGPIPDAEVQPLVQIYSRGFTGGMYGGRQGRDYITRTQPDNRGRTIGTVIGREGRELVVDVDHLLQVGDGLGFEAPDSTGGPTTGFAVAKVRVLGGKPKGGPVVRQAIETNARVDTGWKVVLTADSALLERARASYAALPADVRVRKTRLDVRLFGNAGSPLKAVFVADSEEVTVRTEQELQPAAKRALDRQVLREQLGRLGETPFALTALDDAALAPGLFLPISELNHLRQTAVEQLMLRRDWARQAMLAARSAQITDASSALTTAEAAAPDARAFQLSAQVFRIEDADAAAEAGATEIVLDPFIRHPTPPVSRVKALQERLAAKGVSLRLRTPTIVRPEERKSLQKWLDLGLPVLTGHLGLAIELAEQGRDVTGDYALNVMNEHTADELFSLGVRRLVLSVELTAGEMESLAQPFGARGFDAMIYGRPEGMTIEHCVLSAAFDRVATTCRDLCVQKHTNVEITDPAGYTFPVATDSACRNRLLHSRPVDASEYLPRLWEMGVRGFQMVFNVVDEPVAELTRSYRAQLDALASGTRPNTDAVRAILKGEFTRGHFARAV